MSSSLSNLVDNLSEGIHNYKCTNFRSYLDYMITKGNQLIFRCFECQSNYKENFNKYLIKRFASIYEFCNRNINKFLLLFIFLIPPSTENNFIYLSIRQGMKYKIIFSGVVSVYSSNTYILFFFSSFIIHNMADSANQLNLTKLSYL